MNAEPLVARDARGCPEAGGVRAVNLTTYPTYKVALPSLLRVFSLPAQAPGLHRVYSVCENSVAIRFDAVDHREASTWNFVLCVVIPGFVVDGMLFAE